LIGGLGVLALIALGLVLRPSTAPRANAGGEADERPLVSVAAPGVQAVDTVVSFTGTLAATHDLPLGFDGESGRIAAVFVDIGAVVKRGQALARLDTSVMRPQLERIQASLAEAQAEADLARAEWRRAEGVEASGALSAEQIERRRSTVATAEAKVNVAAAQLAEMRARVARTELRAPADGVILTRNAEVGQIVTSGGEPLFRLAEGGAIELRGRVAEQDLPALAVGQPARVRLTGIDHEFRGRVRLLGAVIDPDTRLGEARIALDPDPRLRPGAFARAEVAVSNAERPVIAQTAVLSDERGNYVLIAGPDDKVVRRNVKVADTTNRGVVIAEGLSGSERVITTAGAFLREGESIRVATPSG
jgi:RND family efflux transporter MFP subunit